MTRHAIVTDIESEAAALLATGQTAAAHDMLLQAVQTAPDDAELWLLLLRTARILGDATAAANAAERLLDLPLTEPRLEALVGHALSQGRIGIARTLIARAETLQDLPASAVARAKALAAHADGDLPAATAILVSAIEAAPHVPALRLLLTEVLMAGGSAGHTRDVLARLGLPPVNPAAPGTELTEDRA
jgi:Flp pilus assembly protein TadD